MIHRHLSKLTDSREWANEWTTDGRYAWKLLLDLPANANVLVLGSGMGNCAGAIAPHVGQVVAMDLSWAQLISAKWRLSLSNPDDNIILVACCDGGCLPFPDASLDCVIVSEPFERTMQQFGAGMTLQKNRLRSRHAQGKAIEVDVLKEIHRTLKSSGQLFLSVPNRFDLQRLRAAWHRLRTFYDRRPPALVQTLHGAFSLEPRHELHPRSFGGYNRLLKSAAFAPPDFFGLLPSYTHLAEVIPLWTSGKLWQKSKPSSLRRAIRNNRYLVPYYGIVAAKHAKVSSSLAERIAGEIEKQVSNGLLRLSLNAFHVTAKDKAVMLGTLGDWPVVVKVPLNESAANGERRNHECLHDLEKDVSLRGFIPRPVASGSLQRIAYYVETRVPGMQLDEALRYHGRTAYLGSIRDFLLRLNPRIMTKPTTQFSGVFFDLQVEEPLRKLADAVTAPLVNRARDFFYNRLHGASVRAGRVHGDLGTSNVFVNGSSVTSVIDWECFQNNGLPLLDVFGFLDSVHRFFTPGATLLTTVPMLARGVWPIQKEREFVTDMYTILGADPQYHDAFVYLNWLHHVAHQLRDPFLYDAKAIEERIIRVLETL